MPLERYHGISLRRSTRAWPSCRPCGSQRRDRSTPLLARRVSVSLQILPLRSKALTVQDDHLDRFPKAYGGLGAYALDPAASRAACAARACTQQVAPTLTLTLALTLTLTPTLTLTLTLT